MAIDSVAIAMLHGARQQPACEVIGITVRTLQYWRIGGVTDQRQIVEKEPANKLSKLEREKILAVCNGEVFKNLPPKQIVPTLADRSFFWSQRAAFTLFFNKRTSCIIEDVAQNQW